jgi:hypothetical protein
VTDPDLAAVRDLPPGTTDPTDESVSRTWHLMTRRQAEPMPARSRRWVPAGAAVVVAGLAAGGVVLFGGGGGGTVAIEAGAVPSSPPSATTTAPPAGGAVNAAPTGPVKLPPSTRIDARTAVNRLLSAVADSPTQTVRPDQFIYTRMDGVTSSDNIGDSAPAAMARDEQELWFAPEGMVAVGNSRSGTDPTDPHSGDKGTAETPVVPVDKPSIWQPTPAWLAGLPTQPAALKAELLEGIGDNDKWSDDHLLSKEIGELLVSSEPLLSGEVRVGMLKIVKGWSGLQARETVIDGRKVWALRHTEQGQFNELLFDPATGRAVGRASGVGDEIGYQVLWTHKIVSKVGDR